MRVNFGTQPTPLTGTATIERQLLIKALWDATHTPHGDGNITDTNRLSTIMTRRNPHPSRGRQLSNPQKNPFTRDDATHTPHGDGNVSATSRSNRSLARRNPHPSRGRQLHAY